jgi:predicted NBD/HSP70 family sugar kinase
VSQSTVYKYVWEAIKAGSRSRVLDKVNGDRSQLSIPMIVEAAQAGDRVALDALVRVGHDLGIGIALLVNALNPDLVVFGGILSLASDFMLPTVEAELEQRALRWTREATRVVRATYGSDACVMGGVATVHQGLMSQPTRLLSQTA